MADESLVVKLSALATRMGSVCKDINAKAEKNASDITSLASTLRTEIATAKAEAISEVTGDGAKEALDTLKEIGDYAESNRSLIDSLTALANGHVHYDKAQTLSAEQKTQARENIGAADDTDVVKLSAQTLTAEQKSQVRSNLDTVSTTDLEAVSASITSLGNDVVKTSAQTLDSSKQTQARTNIGAASATDLTNFMTAVGDLTNIDFVTTFNSAYTPSGN